MMHSGHASCVPWSAKSLLHCKLAGGASTSHGTQQWPCPAPDSEPLPLRLCQQAARASSDTATQTSSVAKLATGWHAHATQASCCCSNSLTLMVQAPHIQLSLRLGVRSHLYVAGALCSSAELCCAVLCCAVLLWCWQLHKLRQARSQAASLCVGCTPEQGCA